ncbi:MAG: hypothetical protein AAFU49_00410 [Pseudomonadota bacterium]
MPIPPETAVLERFHEQDAEVHSLRVSSDRSVVVYDASYPEREGPVPDIPVLIAIMCLSGGGTVVQRTTRQSFEAEVSPGDIGIAAPHAPGFGRWPEMRVIGFGVEVAALAGSFGKSWPRQLRRDAISQPLRDPMVEATMMQVGYTHAGRVNDSVLLHAAHMVVHQLLGGAEAMTDEGDRSETHPLPQSTVDAVRA